MAKRKTLVYGASSIFDEISVRLETEGQDGLFDDTIGTHIVTHLFPQDCPNLTSAMKSLITSFINKTEEELGMCAQIFGARHQANIFLDSVKRKPASSLSIVDINLLQIWFDALCESRGNQGTEYSSMSVLTGRRQGQIVKRPVWLLFYTISSNSRLS